MTRLFKPRRGSVQSMTLDNGSEFAGHEAVAKAVAVATYFCDSYFSSQRGTNENTNGLIRQYFPKQAVSKHGLGWHTAFRHS